MFNTIFNNFIAEGLNYILTISQSESILVSRLSNTIYNNLESINKTIKNKKEHLTYYGSEIKYKYISTNTNENAKADLVLYNSKNEILYVFEVKVRYTWNMIRWKRLNNDWISNKEKYFIPDLKKLKEVPENIKKYFILFLIHYNSLNVQESINYGEDHNKNLQKYINLSDVVNDVENFVEKKFTIEEFSDYSIKLEKKFRLQLNSDQIELPVELITFVFRIM